MITKDKRTSKCIVCGKPAVCWTGHLKEYEGQHIDDTIMAGFCREHKKDYGNLPELKGCFGQFLPLIHGLEYEFSLYVKDKYIKEKIVKVSVKELIEKSLQIRR